MNNPFGFDPSKMDPQVLMQLSQLVQQLPPEKLGKMQTLMHNMMAGYDVRKEMEEFERSLPPEFRSQMMSLVGSSGGAFAGATAPADIEVAPTPSKNMDMRDARMTVLRAVAANQMSPEEAEKILFPDA